LLFCEKAWLSSFPNEDIQNFIMEKPHQQNDD